MDYKIFNDLIKAKSTLPITTKSFLHCFLTCIHEMCSFGTVQVSHLCLPDYNSHDTQPMTSSHVLQSSSYPCHSLLFNNHIYLFAFAPLFLNKPD